MIIILISTIMVMIFTTKTPLTDVLLGKLMGFILLRLLRHGYVKKYTYGISKYSFKRYFNFKSFHTVPLQSGYMNNITSLV